MSAMLSETAADTAPQAPTPTPNTAVGFNALINNTIGTRNTACGSDALEDSTTGEGNTATGSRALFLNTTGSSNTGIGTDAMFGNTTGEGNTAAGRGALGSNLEGNSNTAIGVDALLHNTTGSNNIAVGSIAGINLTVGDRNIDIGNRGVAGEGNTIRIGGTQTNAFIAGISGATVPTGVAVIVDTTGHLGTITSSARYKEAIKPMANASEAILALQPVTFRYKYDLDPRGIPQFGLVAEEVENINPDLLVRDQHGRPYSVRYEAVNAMLLNEFLKEHRKVEEEGATIANLQKQIEVLTAGLQEVKTQVETSRFKP